MKVKVGMRVLNAYYGAGKHKTRILLSDILGHDALTEFTEKYGTLEALAEAKDEELLSMHGIGSEVLKKIKATVQAYYNRIIKWDTLTGMPKDINPVIRVRWGMLMEASSVYGVSINKLGRGLEKLPKNEKKYIKLRFGLNEKGKSVSLAKISKELNIPVSELEEFEIKALNDFTHLMVKEK